MSTSSCCAGLWTGQPVSHLGRHYRLAGPDWSAVAHPPPAQVPAIPVWVAGTWPGTRPFARGARWDGVVPMRLDGTWSVADTEAVAARVRRHGRATGPFDIAVPGERSG